MSDAYLWLKAFHMVAVISWMAGLLYLPRLFVYHCGAEPGSDKYETFKIMERRLYYAIMAPAMVLSFGLGGALFAVPGVADWSGDIWAYVKLALAVLMLVLHGMMGRWRRDFALDRNRRSERFYRVANEAPTVVMIAMVVFVVVKPF